MNMADKIFRVEVPQKTITQIKGGRKQEKEEKIFPGYVLVEMIMDEDSWYVVRHTAGVTKFVGSAKNLFQQKTAKLRKLFTVQLLKHRKSKWMLKSVKKLELYPVHLQNLLVILLKFILIRLNSERWFLSLDVKPRLN